MKRVGGPDEQHATSRRTSKKQQSAEETWARGESGLLLPGSDWNSEEGKQSKFRGVCWDKSKPKWMASIKIEARPKFLGYFDNEEAAARKYDEHASSLGRPLNFPSEGQAQATKGKSSMFRGVHWCIRAQ